MLEYWILLASRIEIEFTMGSQWRSGSPTHLELFPFYSRYLLPAISVDLECMCSTAASWHVQYWNSNLTLEWWSLNSPHIRQALIWWHSYHHCSSHWHTHTDLYPVGGCGMVESIPVVTFCSRLVMVMQFTWKHLRLRGWLNSITIWNCNSCSWVYISSV